MHNAVAISLTALLVLSLVVFRLLWGGAQVAAASGSRQLPILPKRWQRCLHGDRDASKR